MMRLALLLSVLAAPVTAQTAPDDRLGRWIAAPVSQGTILQAPASGPLITTAPAPHIILTPPEVASVVTTPPVIPDTRPLPRPDAVDLAGGTTTEVVAEVEVSPAVAARVAAIAEPEVATAAISSPNATRPPNVVPELADTFSVTAQPYVPFRASAVLLPVRAPDIGRAERSVSQPVAVLMPPPETTPILPRLSPSGPAAQDAIDALPLSRTGRLAAVLLPSPMTLPAILPHLVRAPAPTLDLFPMSAMPPSALPEAPESFGRVRQPPHTLLESNAAVLIGPPMAIPARLSVPIPAPTPTADRPALDPEAPIVLPDPDPRALARMMEDAMICWRMADLDMEAHWARLSVDVALDETNRPSAASIRLTGFAHTVSGAAESAYRAAHASLIGCAEATDHAPATASATLVFDRSGVRLQ